MENRRCRRVSVRLSAERISGDETHGVFIDNISEKGIHLSSAPSSTRRGYVPGKEVDLHFNLSSGETIKLKCRIMWSLAAVPPDDMADSIGLEVIDPPPEYVRFVNSLSMNHLP